MLRWQEEDQRALVSDAKEGFFARTPYSAPQRSQRQRTGTFQLKADGALEGSVEYVYTGHVAHTKATSDAGGAGPGEENEPDGGASADEAKFEKGGPVEPIVPRKSSISAFGWIFS